MRGAILLAAVVSLGGLGALRAAGAAPSALKEPGRPSAQQGGWAIYAGASPFGAGAATFLIGDDWAPRLFERAPADLPIGAQGRMIWHGDAERPLPQIDEFDAAEVPVRPADLAEGAGEPAIFQGRARAGCVMLLRALAPGDPRVLALVKRWYKQKELTPAEWAFALRAGGFPKALQAAAKTEPESAYELLGEHLQARRFGAARALLHGRGKKLEPLLAARHDEAEVGCAPVATARDGAEPTGLPWARLLELAAQFAEGKKGPARKGLQALLRKTPRLRESLCLDAPDRLPDHELFRPERPRALLRQIPGFLDLLR